MKSPSVNQSRAPITSALSRLVVSSVSNVPTENPKGTGIEVAQQKAAAHLQQGKSSRRDETSSSDGVEYLAVAVAVAVVKVNGGCVRALVIASPSAAPAGQR
jgi:hypothetical protein